jgi:glycosyltransferase involved in cell wall biosynthesis
MISGGNRSRGLLRCSLPDQPLITIITVVYNRVKYLEQAILSVLDQTYSNIEYIIIDGGSTDGTLEIIKKYDNRLDYWISETDKGMYFALNKGVELANGELIGICHSDDYYYSPDIIQQLIDTHEKVHSDIYHGNAMMIFESPIGTSQKLAISDSEAIIKTERSIIHPTTFILKKVFSKYGIYNTQFRSAADYELMIRYKVQNCTFFHLETIISGIRVLNQDRISNNCYSHIEAYKFHKFHHTGHHNHYIFSFIKCWSIRKAKRVLNSFNIRKI